MSVLCSLVRGVARWAWDEMGADIERHRAYVERDHRHRDEYPAGQIAQRLDVVTFVDVDTLKARRPPPRLAKRHFVP